MSDYTELVKALRERQGLLCYGEGACPENCELLMNHGCYTKLHMDAAAAIEALQAELEKKRTADCWGCKCEKVEPKRGKWSHVERVDRSWETDEIFGFVVQCSICGNKTIGASLYCPNCGAKMEVQDEVAGSL